MALLDKQNRPPKVEILPDERKRVTYFYDVTEDRLKDQAKFLADVKLAWGAADAAYATCLLIDQRMADPSLKPSTDRHIFIRVYEEIHATNETQVGGNTQIKLEDGRTAIEQEFLKFSSAGFTPSTVGSSGGPSSTYLMKEEATNDGTLYRIKRTWVAAGLLQQDDQESHNGALLKRTLTYAVTVPPTPAGYTLVGSPVQHPNGLPIYTYTFYSGDGEISRTIDRSQNGTTTDGSEGVTKLTIMKLTGPAASEPSWSGTSGYTKVLVDEDERDGHKVWRAVFAKGAGLVEERIDYDALPGLRVVTNISLGTKVTPTGIVTRDDWRNAEGYRVFTVTAIQTAGGGADPTAASVSAERLVNFTYPGRAKAFTETYDGKLMLAAFLSPPVTTLVVATVAISYVTIPTLGSPSPAYWNPSDWATIKKQWVGAYGKQTSEIRALPGYRSVSETPVTHTGDGTDSSIEGSIIYNGTTARITVTGGPADPGGNSYTLDAEIDPNPVFTSTGGTNYYRKIVVTATIPAQAALPV